MFCIRLLSVRRTLHLFRDLGVIGSVKKKLSIQMVLTETRKLLRPNLIFYLLTPRTGSIYKKITAEIGFALLVSALEYELPRTTPPKKHRVRSRARYDVVYARQNFRTLLTFENKTDVGPSDSCSAHQGAQLSHLIFRLKKSNF
jgi:hypothetical protein